MLIVDQGRPKCFSVEAPQSTFLKISYVAPGKYYWCCC
jgi:hypothetical protein